jgi:hypothetical protein
MRRQLFRNAICLVLFLCVGFGCARKPTPKPTPPPALPSDIPIKVTVCDLKRDPVAYDHRLVEVTGFTSHAFEDFTLFDMNCPEFPNVWIEYGGTVTTKTMYSGGDTNSRVRPEPIKVEGVSVPLIEDENFREFDRQVQHLSASSKSISHATVIGRFFAGEERIYPKARFWGGYGHMGRYTLLVIQKVVSVTPWNRTDVDYLPGVKFDEFEISKVHRNLLFWDYEDELMKGLKRCEAGGREWAFDDPRRVAAAFLAESLEIGEQSVSGLKLVRDVPGQKTFQWNATGNEPPYLIVVSRPFFLTFFAKDPNRIPWLGVQIWRGRPKKV